MYQDISENFSPERFKYFSNHSLILEPSCMKELKSYSYPLECFINQLTNVTIDSYQAVSDMSAKGEKNKALRCTTIKIIMQTRMS